MVKFHFKNCQPTEEKTNLDIVIFTEDQISKLLVKSLLS